MLQLQETAGSGSVTSVELSSRCAQGSGEFTDLLLCQWLGCESRSESLMWPCSCCPGSFRFLRIMINNYSAFHDQGLHGHWTVLHSPLTLQQELACSGIEVFAQVLVGHTGSAGQTVLQPGSIVQRRRRV